MTWNRPQKILSSISSDCEGVSKLNFKAIKDVYVAINSRLEAGFTYRLILWLFLVTFNVNEPLTLLKSILVALYVGQILEFQRIWNLASALQRCFAEICHNTRLVSRFKISTFINYRTYLILDYWKIDFIKSEGRVYPFLEIHRWWVHRLVVNCCEKRTHENCPSILFHLKSLTLEPS